MFCLPTADGAKLYITKHGAELSVFIEGNDQYKLVAVTIGEEK
jgi:hypothetical protein